MSWSPTRVTLLRDAIHNLTPMAGIGANTALRDAALLADRLSAAGPDVGPGLFTTTLRAAEVLPPLKRSMFATLGS